MKRKTRKLVKHVKSKRRSVKAKAKKTPLQQIPIPAPVLNYVYTPSLGNDFYAWVNRKWHPKILPFENDFGVAEEAERVIFKASENIIDKIYQKSVPKKGTVEEMIHQLAKSCLIQRNQYNSVETLKKILHRLDCIVSKEDVVKEFAALSAARFPSILSVQYTFDSNQKSVLCLDGHTPSIPISFYSSLSKMRQYKSLLHRVGEKLGVKGVDKIIPIEKQFVYVLEKKWKDDLIFTTGNGLLRKFPKFPWETWFERLGISDWKKKEIGYRNPFWFRYISRCLSSISIDLWKLFLARSYIVQSIQFLPPPFDDFDFQFFDKSSQGQVIKTPQKELLINTIYSFFSNDFSKLFWEEYGSEEITKEAKPFLHKLKEATKYRLSETNWLAPRTRKYAIEKVEKMRGEIVRPSHWEPFEYVELSESDFLGNIFLLGNRSWETMKKKLGTRAEYWDVGIYQVNAFYYTEGNQITIPYGTMISPFYTDNRPAWNFGGLGSIIGHEICHGFDDDGKNYDADGKKKRWWTKGDIYAYNKKTRGLIDLFDKEIVEGKHMNGKKTLDENIADLGGLGIALEALKQDQKRRGVSVKEDILAEWREFFISFATSWRTKYRKEKLKRVVELDVHSPAFLRVNLIVNQFDEWYEAFGIEKDADLWIEPEKRIRIF